MQVVVDRIEGIYAICEKQDRTIIELKLDLLPNGIKDGTVLNIENGNISIDEIETSNKKNAAQKLLNDIF